MTGPRLIELAVAALLLVAGIYFYRRKPADNVQGGSAYGNQGAVILIVVAVIVAIHALGGLDYRPSTTELEAIEGAHR